MSINATNTGVKRELIPAGNYAARCYSMIHIGTVEASGQTGDRRLFSDEDSSDERRISS